MAVIAPRCPFCGSDQVRKNGFNNGKQRYICKNVECSHKTFYTKYTYPGCKRLIKYAIVRLSETGNGTRRISRLLGISKDTVAAALKNKEEHGKRCEGIELQKLYNKLFEGKILKASRKDRTGRKGELSRRRTEFEAWLRIVMSKD
jgi:transposase-like protein